MMLKLFSLLAIALVAFSGESDAHGGGRRRRHHHKKTKLPLAVENKCGKGQATIVIDGLPSKFAKDHLKNVPLDITLTFILNRDEITARHNQKLIKYAKDQGHTIGYRFDPAMDKTFNETSPKKIAEDALEAQEMFRQFHDLELEYVWLPYCKHHLTKHVEALEEAGLVPFGNNMWIDVAFRKTSKSHVKGELKKLADKKRGAIVYMDADNSKLLEDIKLAHHYFRTYHFDLVDLDECLADEEALDEKPSDNVEAPNPPIVVVQPSTASMAASTVATAPEKPAEEPKKEEAKTAGTEKDGSAAGLSVAYSGAALAAAAAVSATAFLF